MLAIQNKQLNSIFERIVKDKNGILVRVRFIVVEIEGQYRPQIISAEPFVTTLKTETCVACLPNPETKLSVIFTYTKAAPIKSFYFNELFFFTSQPTRAPSF